MKSFPMFVRLDGGRRVVIAGGGEAAAQKARLLARTEARITLMAPDLEPELAAMVAEGRAEHAPAVLSEPALRGARMALVATGCVGADACIADLARGAGALVNVVDRPEMCEATFPALVDRDPLVVAIGTEGAAPVLARRVKTALEGMLEPGLGRFVAAMGALRPRIAQAVARPRRRGFWEWAVEGPRRRFLRGDEAGAMAEIDAALAAGGAPEAAARSVAVLDPGPGPADMVTLRAVQRLQSADAVVHPAGLGAAVLDLARRDAERLAVPDASAEALAEAAAGAEAPALVVLAPEAVAVAAALAARGIVAEVVPAPRALSP